MFEAYVAYKREEWEAYHSAVSEWELQRYLEFF
jgi:glutamine synthetase